MPEASKKLNDNGRINVVVIDDNLRSRYIIKETLKTEEDIHICDEAETLEQAKNILARWRPDIAILDLSLDENEGGLKLLQEISQLHLPTNFIVLSAHAEASYSQKSLQAGAKGYICKDKTVRCLGPAIHSVHSGKEFVS